MVTPSKNEVTKIIEFIDLCCHSQDTAQLLGLGYGVDIIYELTKLTSLAMMQTHLDGPPRQFPLDSRSNPEAWKLLLDPQRLTEMNVPLVIMAVTYGLRERGVDSQTMDDSQKMQKFLRDHAELIISV